jgi:hypothetical protein
MLCQNLRWYSLTFIYIIPPRSVHYTITALCVGKHPDLSNFVGYLPCGGKLYVNKRQGIPKGQSKKDDPEKMGI